MVWEPVLKSDVAAPLSGALGLIRDRRVEQYWDQDRVLSAEFVRSVNEEPSRFGLEERLPPDFIAWDLIAVFGASARWEEDVPVPLFYDGPVRTVIVEAKRAIAGALTAPPRRVPPPSPGTSPPNGCGP